MEWTVELYATENGDEPVRDFLATLPQKHLIKALWEIDLLEKLGTTIHEPYAKPIKGDEYKGLWELRIKIGSDSSRVFYFLPLGHTFILLHGFLKKSNKTPKRELDTAKKHMEDHLRRCQNAKL
jgi:phage-related protein